MWHLMLPDGFDARRSGTRNPVRFARPEHLDKDSVDNRQVWASASFEQALTET